MLYENELPSSHGNGGVSIGEEDAEVYKNIPFSRLRCGCWCVELLFKDVPVSSSAHEPVAAGEAAASVLVKEGIAYGHHVLLGHGVAGSRMVRCWCLNLSF